MDLGLRREAHTSHVAAKIAKIPAHSLVDLLVEGHHGAPERKCSWL